MNGISTTDFLKEIPIHWNASNVYVTGKYMQLKLKPSGNVLRAFEIFGHFSKQSFWNNFQLEMLENYWKCSRKYLISSFNPCKPAMQYYNSTKQILLCIFPFIFFVLCNNQGTIKSRIESHRCSICINHNVHISCIIHNFNSWNDWSFISTPNALNINQSWNHIDKVLQTTYKQYVGNVEIARKNRNRTRENHNNLTIWQNYKCKLNLLIVNGWPSELNQSRQSEILIKIW